MDKRRLVAILDQGNQLLLQENIKPVTASNPLQILRRLLISVDLC